LRFGKPILGITGLFIVGIVAGRYFFSPSFLPLLYFIEIILLILTFFVYFFRKIKVTTLLILMAVFLWGVLHFCIHYFPSPTDIVRYAPSLNPVRITGRIITSPRLREGKRKRITFMMQALWMEEKKVDGKVWVTSFFPYKYYGYGDIVKIEGKLGIPRKAQKESSFDWRRYLSYQGVWTEVTTGKIEVLARKRGNPLTQLAFSSRDWIRRKIDKILPPPYCSVLKGILLGDREELPLQVLRNFQLTGTAHILVVSGLHVGLLFFVVFTLTRLIGFSQKIALSFALPIIVYYSFLTGLRPPIVRASLMAAMGVVCYFLDREVSLIVILSLVAFIILIINPLSLFTVSFQLSFLAVGGIIYLTPYLERKWNFLPKLLRRSLSVSTSAQLFLLPLFSFYFRQFPLIGFFANLLIVPFLTPILSLGFLSLATATFSLWAAQIFFNTTWFLLRSLLFVVDFLSFSWAPDIAQFFSPQVESPPLWMLLIYYVLLITLPFSSSFSFKGKDN